MFCMLCYMQGIAPDMLVRIVAKDPGDFSLLRYVFGEPQVGFNIDMDVSNLEDNIKNGGGSLVQPIRFVSRVTEVRRCWQTCNMVLAVL